MRLRSTALAVALALLGGGCSRQAETRVRVSYTVEDNGARRAASGVWSSTVRYATVPLVEEYESEFHGEAIPLALPGRGVLLLMPIGEQGSTGDAGTLIRQTFQHLVPYRDDDLVWSASQRAQLVGVSKPIRCERYAIPRPRPEPREPTFDLCLNFTFVADPKDQSTLRRVDVNGGRLEGLDGVRLRDARVTITLEPVTRGIEKLLPWLPLAQDYWLNRTRSTEDRARLDQEIIYMRN